MINFAINQFIQPVGSVTDSMVFADTIDEYDFRHYSADHIIHILCLDGSISFVLQNVHYNIVRGDYIILSNLSFASEFTQSHDCRCFIMSFAESFVISMSLRSNYGFIGRFALLRNPVMKLSEYEFEKCVADLQRLRQRVDEHGHLFHEEMVGHLLLAHILDLYDIHARKQKPEQVPERAASVIKEFIGLLYNGDYIRYRNLNYYASRLCITPHYLSEICKKVSGEPASYWIDRFTIYEAVRLLRQKELPLAVIADKLNFSSFSYFSRYVHKRIGVSPSAYRYNFLNGW